MPIVERSRHAVRKLPVLYAALRPLWRTGKALVRPLEPTLELRQWRRMNRPVPPPPRVKQAVVRRYGQAFGYRTLVETGTYLGDMVEAQRHQFDRVISIELAPDLYRRAVRRFVGAKNVELIEGDSATVLPRIVRSLVGPAVFWLDGHWSGGVTARGDLDTPVGEELRALLESPLDNCILIDDAREFGTGDYPSIEELRRVVAEERPEWVFAVHNDVIRIHPRITSLDGNLPDEG